MAGALVKAVRVGTLTENEAAAAVRVFRDEWTDFVRIRATEAVVARADEVAWRLDLGGCAGIHLASALLWQETMDEVVILATYDGQLWRAAAEGGLERLPERRR